MRDPIGLWDQIVGEDEKSGHARAGRGGKVGLLHLFQPDVAHSVERQLPLFGATLFKPGEALPHLLET